MATRKEKQIIKRKQAIAHSIRNIRSDYAGVLAEDLPQEIADEIRELFAEMRELNIELAAEVA